jgi:hypothetical protein
MLCPQCASCRSLWLLAKFCVLQVHLAESTAGKAEVQGIHTFPPLQESPEEGCAVLVAQQGVQGLSPPGPRGTRRCPALSSPARPHFSWRWWRQAWVWRSPHWLARWGLPFSPWNRRPRGVLVEAAAGTRETSHQRSAAHGVGVLLSLGAVFPSSSSSSQQSLGLSSQQGSLSPCHWSARPGWLGSLRQPQAPPARPGRWEHGEPRGGRGGTGDDDPGLRKFSRAQFTSLSLPSVL